MIEEIRARAKIERLEPPSGSLTAAILEGRRRRGVRRRLQITAVTTLLLVGLAGSVAFSGADRSERLLAADRGAARESEGPTTGLQLEDGAPVGSSAPSGSSPDDSSTAGASSSLAPSATGTEIPPRRGAKGPMERSQVTKVVGCVDWCMLTYATRWTDGSDRYTLWLDVCVPAHGADHRFTFETTQEVDFAISSEGESAAPLWTWSTGQAFTRNLHEVGVPGGQCIRWGTAWDSTDEQGRPLPKGSYALHATFLANEASGNRKTVSTFDTGAPVPPGVVPL